MLLADLLDRAAAISAPLDTTDLGPLRARLFGRLRASGWAPSGALRGSAPSLSTQDEDLLRALVRGEAAAFDALFERHAARLNGYARRWLQPADAADAVQETFLVLFEKSERVLAHASVNLSGFLFGTLRNKVRRALAFRARSAATGESPEDEPSSEADALATLLQHEDAERVARLLDKVCNPLEQEVIAMDLDSQGGEAIAQALDISLVNVRQVRFRALGKLRQALAEQERR